MADKKSRTKTTSKKSTAQKSTSKKTAEKPLRKKSTKTTKKQTSGQSSGRKKATASARRTSKNQDSTPFPVIGIGASAGGLEALEGLFSRMPSDTGAAFVIIVHLRPHQSSMMPELVQRHTDMPVHQISDRMKVAPNEVFIIPPNYQVQLADNHLELSEREEDGPPTTIDRFFETLAREREDRAIAVILSGAGSDGAKGGRAVQDKLGLVVCQDPDTARHRGMPEAATRFADQVLRIEEIPQFVVNYLKGDGAKQRIKLDEDGVKRALSRIFYTLKQHTGHDFSSYKRNTIDRRIARRLSILDVAGLEEYSQYLQENRKEVQTLFRELLISVTSFFRDPEAYEVLEKKVFPKIIQNKQHGTTVRVWVPGVATGEEAYSIAILLEELKDKKQKDFKIQIFATDIDENAIDYARAAAYPEGIRDDISEQRLSRFFEREGDQYRVKRHIREMVVFAVQNVIKDPPFTRLDLISCRNLLIYLDKDIQQKLLPMFHYSLRRGGFLLLGTSESIGELNNSFEEIDGKLKIFRANESSDSRHPFMDFPLTARFNEVETENSAVTRRSGKGLTDTVSQVLMDEYMPPSVVINRQGDILHIVGRTGKLLEPAPGDASLNIFNMAREGLKVHLQAAVRRAANKWTEDRRERVRVKTNGDEIIVTLIVRPLDKSDPSGDLILVVFKEEERHAEPARRKTDGEEISDQEREDDRRDLEQELQHTRENLQSTVEELETSNEELKSTNEEYQSTNEELRSANEELETSREELQSLNEELSTVNQELQEKIESVSSAHKEMQNFLNSLGVPTVFLDNELCIKRFTVQALDIIKVIDSDVGRPFSDLSYGFRDDSLLDDARRVRDTLKYQEKEIETDDGRWFLRRIIPFQSGDDGDVGVVINFIDINELKQKSLALQRTESRLQATRLMVETLPQPLLLLDDEMMILSTNNALLRMFDLKRDQVVGKQLMEIADEYFEQSSFRSALKDIFSESDTSHLEVTLKLPSGVKGTVAVRARRAVLGDDMQPRILLQFGTIEQGD